MATHEGAKKSVDKAARRVIVPHRLGALDQGRKVVKARVNDRLGMGVA